VAGADHVQVFMAVPAPFALGMGVGVAPGHVPGPCCRDEWQKSTKQVLCQLGKMVDALVAKGLHWRRQWGRWEVSCARQHLP